MNENPDHAGIAVHIGGMLANRIAEYMPQIQHTLLRGEDLPAIIVMRVSFRRGVSEGEGPVVFETEFSAPEQRVVMPLALDPQSGNIALATTGPQLTVYPATVPAPPTMQAPPPLPYAQPPVVQAQQQWPPTAPQAQFLPQAPPPLLTSQPFPRPGFRLDATGQEVPIPAVRPQLMDDAGIVAS